MDLHRPVTETCRASPRPAPPRQSPPSAACSKNFPKYTSYLPPTAWWLHPPAMPRLRRRNNFATMWPQLSTAVNITHHQEKTWGNHILSLSQYGNRCTLDLSWSWECDVVNILYLSQFRRTFPETDALRSLLDLAYKVKHFGNLRQSHVGLSYP